MNYRHNEAGFTLIELVIVVAIIGILASIAIPQYGKVMSRAKYGKAVGDMTSLAQVAIAAYSDSPSGTWPADVGTNALPTEFKPYLHAWPKGPCPGWTYDWENWVYPPTTTYRITLRDGTGTSRYLYCISTNDTACATGIGLDGLPGVPEIRTLTSKDLGC